MKNTTKILILLLTLLQVQYAIGQCTPNAQMPKGAILPEQLKVGYANQSYSEVIYYRAPLDTTVESRLGTFPVRIDSMEIIKVEGLPNGFTFKCNTDNCRFNGGVSGCLTLSGTLNTTGSFPIKVYLKTYATVKTTFADIPQTQEDINDKYVLNIYGAVGVGMVSLKDAIVVYPNPAKDYLYINNYYGGDYEAILTDFTGRKVYVESFVADAIVSTKELLQGVYFLQIKSGEEAFIKKIIIE